MENRIYFMCVCVYVLVNLYIIYTMYLYNSKPHVITWLNKKCLTALKWNF